MANLKRNHLGLTSYAYYIGFSPLLNWIKQATPWNLSLDGVTVLGAKAAWDAGYFENATGDLKSPATGVNFVERLFFSGPAEGSIGLQALGIDYSLEPWVVEWDGTATCTIRLVEAGGSQTPVGSNRVNFVMGNDQSNILVRFTLTNVNDPPRNIRLYQARYETNVANGERWNPDWLREVSKFGILRMMDINNSEITTFSQLATADYFAIGQPYAPSILDPSEYRGPKGGMGPDLLCELANAAGTEIHVCIPHLLDDAGVIEFATYMRDHTTHKVHYEYSNECWNFSFYQTIYCANKTIATGIPGWYGYRAAQVMKMVRDVYNDRSRWSGVLASQTVNTAVSDSALQGVNYFRAHDLSPANSLAVSDLFDELAITGYFGDVQPAPTVTGITKANPGVVTALSHGFVNGQRIKMFVGTGMTELNDTFATVGSVTTDTFTLVGVNTSAMTTYADGRNYAMDATLWDLMDASELAHTNTPVTYPTKYTFYNQTVAQSHLTGLGGTFVTSVSVASLKATYWPAQRAIALANGLSFRQYESGCHFVGLDNLSGSGGNVRFSEWIVQYGYSAECAAVYAAEYAGWLRAGGLYPTKFVESGSPSRYGTWGGIRYWPTVANGNTDDTGNPVWQATLNINNNLIPDTYSITL